MTAEPAKVAVGDIIVEWYYRYWGKKGKGFIEHKVARITPTGIIKTTDGMELDKFLRPRGKSRHGDRDSYYSVLTNELKAEMYLQNLKDSLQSQLEKLDLQESSLEDLEKLADLLNKFKRADE